MKVVQHKQGIISRNSKQGKQGCAVAERMLTADELLNCAVSSSICCFVVVFFDVVVLFPIFIGPLKQAYLKSVQLG